MALLPLGQAPGRDAEKNRLPPAAMPVPIPRTRPPSPTQTRGGFVHMGKPDSMGWGYAWARFNGVVQRQTYSHVRMSKGRSEPKILPVGMARAQLPHADSTGSLGDGLRNGVFRDDRLRLVGGQAGSTQPSGKNSGRNHPTHRPSHSNDGRLRSELHYS